MYKKDKHESNVPTTTPTDYQVIVYRKSGASKYERVGRASAPDRIRADGKKSNGWKGRDRGNAESH
jgi:hypothetical protein